MNRPTQFFNCAFFALLATLISCQHQENVSPSKEEPYALSYIKSLGFKSEDIAKIGSTYFVQGDIMFSDTLRAPITKGGRTEQYYYGSLIDVSRQRDIKIKINSNISSLSYQIQNAVSMWNDVASQGSNIGLRVVSSGTYDIEISSVPSLGTCGSSAYPSSGAPGAVIYIDLGVLGGTYSDAQKAKTIAHEIGHALGFVHTNWNNGGGGPSGIDVPGVGGNDPNSIMNGNQCNAGATTLSTNDKAALVSLYPITTPWALSYNGDHDYPRTISWQSPKYTGAGTVVGYDFYYVATTYQAGVITSPVYAISGTNYTFPFYANQYNGASLVSYVRAKYSNGFVSDWNAYNTTLY